jgi:hypothetical protein
VDVQVREVVVGDTLRLPSLSGGGAKVDESLVHGCPEEEVGERRRYQRAAQC